MDQNDVDQEKIAYDIIFHFEKSPYIHTILPNQIRHSLTITDQYINGKLLSDEKSLIMKNKHIASKNLVHFEYMDQLVYLDLEDNEIDDLGEIIKLKELIYLNLKRNKIFSLDKSFNNVRSIWKLDISYNSIVKISKKIFMNNLRILNMNGCQLDRFPLNFVKKSRETIMNISMTNNLLEDMPICMAIFDSLVRIDLSSNKFNRFPSSLSLIESLEILILKNNNISLIPDNIHNLTKLKELNLDDNKISSLREICHCGSLVKLSLKRNKIVIVCSNIRSLFNLEYLDLSFNRIMKLPESLFILPNLNSLYLKNNRLNVFTATNFESYITTLDLSFNNLETISLEKYNHLIYVNLSNNHLYAISISIAHNLASIDLSNNAFHDYPQSLIVTKFITKINMSNNFITVVPKLYSSSSSQVYIYLKRNYVKIKNTSPEKFVIIE